MLNQSSTRHVQSLQALAGSLVLGGFLLLSGCDASSSSSQDAISTFGLSMDSITQGQTVKVTAILSDSNLSGRTGFRGVLLDPNGNVYGAFINQGGPDSYTYDITWDQLHTMHPIGFASEDVRMLIAEFVDEVGNKSSRRFSLRLHCGGEPACEGQCVKSGASCPVSKNLQCLAGKCGIGCVVGSSIVQDGQLNPENPCEICDVSKSKTSFSAVAAFTTCGSKLSCSYDRKCNVPFRMRQLQSTAGFRILHLATMTGGRTLALAGSIFTPSQELVAATPTSVFSGFSSNIRTRFKLNGTTLYESSSSAFSYSTDGGQTFSSPPAAVSLSGTTAIWASSPTDVWTGNSSGRIYRSSDNLTTAVQAADPRGGLMGRAILAISGTGPTDVYFVNDKTEAFRTTTLGASYTSLPLAPDVPNAFWARATNDVYIGTNAGFYRYTSATGRWTPLTPPAGSTGGGPGRAIAACSSNDIFFAGQSEVWHSTDGSTMTLLPTTGVGQTGNWYAIDCLAPGRAIVGGNGGESGQPLIIESF